jgi:hypothetical protein
LDSTQIKNHLLDATLGASDVLGEALSMAKQFRDVSRAMFATGAALSPAFPQFYFKRILFEENSTVVSQLRS